MTLRQKGGDRGEDRFASAGPMKPASRPPLQTTSPGGWALRRCANAESERLSPAEEKPRLAAPGSIPGGIGHHVKHVEGAGEERLEAPGGERWSAESASRLDDAHDTFGLERR